MVFLFMVLMIIIILIIIDFTLGFKFFLSAHIDDEQMEISTKCLYPFLNIEVKVEDNVPSISVYVFKLRLYKTRLFKRGNRKGAFSGYRFFKAACIRHLNVAAMYGFSNPFTTGIAYSAASIAAIYLPAETFIQKPDFLSAEAYLKFNADGNFKLGHTIIRYFKN